VVGHALVGGGSGAAHAATDQAAPAETQQQQYSNPCAQQMQAFLECANKNANDLSLCYGFNEALKECKAQFSKCFGIVIDSSFETWSAMNNKSSNSRGSFR